MTGSSIGPSRNPDGSVENHEHAWGPMHSVADLVYVRPCLNRECDAVQQIDRSGADLHVEVLP